jgi:hypothetical protein
MARIYGPTLVITEVDDSDEEEQEGEGEKVIYNTHV